MPDQIQKNTVDIAILQTQYGNIEKTLVKIHELWEKHDAKDDVRHDDLVEKLDLAHKDNDELKQMIAGIKQEQAVEKVKLGVIVAGVVLVAKELVVFVVHKII